MRFKGQGNDILWLLLGVVLIFGTMAAFSPGSFIGKNFVGVRKSLENMFGGELGYCPFINPYAMTLYSSGQLEITGDHPLCGPMKYAIGEVASVAGVNCSDVNGNAVYSIRIDAVEQCANKEFDESVNCVNVSKSKDLTLVSGYEDIDGSVYHYTGENLVGMSSDYFFARLSDIQQDEVDKSNKIAIQLMTEKRPAWQCFLIFGILPFAITYYLLGDILSFAMLRTNTKRLIAIFASLIAVLTGAFANLVVAVSSLVGMSVGQSFLVAIFAFAILAVFLGQVTMTAGVAKATATQVASTAKAMLTLGAISASQDALDKSKGSGGG